MRGETRLLLLLLQVRRLCRLLWQGGMVSCMRLLLSVLLQQLLLQQVQGAPGIVHARSRSICRRERAVWCLQEWYGERLHLMRLHR